MSCGPHSCLPSFLPHRLFLRDSSSIMCLQTAVPITASRAAELRRFPVCPVQAELPRARLCIQSCWQLFCALHGALPMDIASTGGWTQCHQVLRMLLINLGFRQKVVLQHSLLGFAETILTAFGRPQSDGDLPCAQRLVLGEGGGATAY